MPTTRPTDTVRRLPRLLARGLIRGYQLTVSPFLGSDCRHLPTCSVYGDEAIGRFGLWAGGWMTLARFCRCHPLGTRGLDFVPGALPAHARWWLPWRYGRWRGTLAEPPPSPAGPTASPDADPPDTPAQRAEPPSPSSRRAASAEPSSAAR
ncbi:membrane protein insertion efficiency factor YidD [Rhodoplanes serenus]|uniref:Putative membrane protein insertion efficiency factor n=1 Tax=Rhodoplanes serenus TaxID=200615 RepID=A0A9X5ATE0_9BRAD|nr:membrane protein insertion efficiency factor YidD [Rhodoplanes serenus]MTW17314.1 membrane protein insertion efficiency factor YidD [Rhodoplanes serenus]